MISLDIAIKSKEWQKEKNIEKSIERICQKLIPLTDLKKLLTKKVHLELSVSLVSDRQIKKINQQFRGKNKATDILSFSTLDESLIRRIGINKAIKPRQYLFLGDIVIAFSIVRKEALAQKKRFLDHLTHLILHGILHLIGHDHELKNMAETMENLEVKILKKLGISNPYNQHLT